MRTQCYSHRVLKSTRKSPQGPLRVAHVVDLLALAGMEYGVIKLALHNNSFDSAFITINDAIKDPQQGIPCH